MKQIFVIFFYITVCKRYISHLNFCLLLQISHAEFCYKNYSDKKNDPKNKTESEINLRIIDMYSKPPHFVDFVDGYEKIVKSASRKVLEEMYVNIFWFCKFHVVNEILIT